MQRLPSLINSDRNLLFTFLSNYEILGCEPLHDVKQHIDNLYAELPSHLSKTEKKIMEDTILNSFSQKELKRGVDYRRSLVYLNSKLNGKIDKTIFGILSTLCEIQRILYGEERERTIENVIRLHNLVFLHKCLIDDVVGDTPKIVRKRVFRGKYFHALLVHAPTMFRIVSGRTANAEGEERIF